MTISHTRAAELIAMLERDCHLTMREISNLTDIPVRTLRSWKKATGVHKVTNGRYVKELQEIVLIRQCVPWSRSHDGMSHLMWQTYQSAGQERVVELLRAELKKLPDNRGKISEEIKRDIKRAEGKPDDAFDIVPSVYREAGADALACNFEDYAEFMERRFSSENFPSPSKAEKKDWTLVLLLLQFTRDTATKDAPRDVALMRRLHHWLERGCAYLRKQWGDDAYGVWPLICQLWLAHDQMDAQGRDLSLEMRKQLLADFKYFELVLKYTTIIPGNVMVWRNALASASLIQDRSRYHEYYTRLRNLAPGVWHNPRQSRDMSRLDADFDDFVDWWSMAMGRGEASPRTHNSPKHI